MTQKRSAKSGKKRQQIPVLLVLLVVILVACNFPIRDLSFITHSYPTLDPAIFEGHRTPSASTPEVFGQSTPPAIVAPEIDGELYHVYAAQSGDSLPIVAIHFGVSPLQITSPAEIPVSGIIPPGQYLIIPKTTANKVLTNLIPADKDIVLDMSDISFVSSAGWWSIIRVQKELKKKRDDLVLVALNDNVKDSMDLIGILQYFTVYPNMVEALGNL